MGCLRLSEATGSSQPVGEDHGQNGEGGWLGRRPWAEEWPDAFLG